MRWRVIEQCAEEFWLPTQEQVGVAFYLVRARPRGERLAELEGRLAERAFVGLRPFGRALSGSLEGARLQQDGRAVWEEEDYCVPPLAQERAAVLDMYFTELEVERVARGEGWRRIAGLPQLFPGLAGRDSSPVIGG